MTYWSVKTAVGDPPRESRPQPAAPDSHESPAVTS